MPEAISVGGKRDVEASGTGWSAWLRMVLASPGMRLEQENLKAGSGEPGEKAKN